MPTSRNIFDLQTIRIGWFGRVVAVLLSAAMLFAAFVFSAVAVAVVAAVVIVASIKVWWLRRHAPTKAGRLLDAEYEIVFDDEQDNEHAKQREESK